MNLWVVGLLICASIALSASIVPLDQHGFVGKLCPENCKCNPNDSYAVCSTLNSIKFGLETNIFKLIIKNPDQPINLSYEVFKKLNLKHLDDLIIEDAVINELDQSAFNGIETLRHIEIRNSAIPEIPKELFAPLQKLETLRFHNCTLSNYHEIESVTLREITLSKCGIHEVPSSTFANCPSLLYVNLENNHISSFTDPAFLQYVEELRLTENNITNFSFDYINSIEKNKLTKLDLSNNPIKQITDTNGKNLMLEVLILKSCHLKNIEFISELTYLKNVDVSYNEIDDVSPDTLNLLMDLTQIDLSNNKLTALPNALFARNKVLGKVILDSNQFNGTLPRFVTPNKDFQIYYFSCNNCQLSHLEDTTFMCMPTIKTLILSNNNVTTIPEKLMSYIPSLVKLDLSHNNLKELSLNTFLKNQDLANVDLSGNKIHSILPQVFRHNTVLQKLALNNCGLIQMWQQPINKTSLPSLEYINIGDNKIEIISEEELNVNPNLKAINLYHNHFKCDKYFKVMQSWLHMRGVQYTLNQELSSEERRKIMFNLRGSICSNNFDDSDDYDSDFNEDHEMKNIETKIETKVIPQAKPIDDSTLDKTDLDVDKGVNKINFVLDKSQSVYNKYDESNTIYSDTNNKNFQEAAADIYIMEPRLRIHNKQPAFGYLAPTLVFLITALLVSIFTICTIMCILRKRNASLSHANSPQITILPWSYSTKVKKHSGSIYRPLSEEIIAPRNYYVRDLSSTPLVKSDK